MASCKLFSVDKVHTARIYKEDEMFFMMYLDIYSHCQCSNTNAGFTINIGLTIKVGFATDFGLTTNFWFYFMRIFVLVIGMDGYYMIILPIFIFRKFYVLGEEQ